MTIPFLPRERLPALAPALGPLVTLLFTLLPRYGAPPPRPGATADAVGGAGHLRRHGVLGVRQGLDTTPTPVTRGRSQLRQQVLLDEAGRLSREVGGPRTRGTGSQRHERLLQHGTRAR